MKKGIGYILLLAVVFWLVGMSMAGAKKDMPTETVEENKIILEYEFAEPAITQADTYDFIEVEGCRQYKRVGAPIIPAKGVKILVPYGKEVADIRGVAIAEHDLEGSYKLAPGLPCRSRNDVTTARRGQPDAEIYGLNTAWPGGYAKKVTIQNQRGHKLLFVNLFPVQYVPARGRISYATKIRLEIELAGGTKAAVRPTKELRARLKREAANPSALASYPAHEKTDEKGEMGRSALKAKKDLDQVAASVGGQGAGGGIRIRESKDGYIRFLGAPPRGYFQVKGAAANAEATADAFLRQRRSLFVDGSPQVEFEKIRARSTNRRGYVKYQQKYLGLEVFAAQVVVQVSDGGGIDAVISDIMRDTKALDSGLVSLNPRISSAEAEKLAETSMAERYPGAIFEASAAQLRIYDPQVVGCEGDVKLVWQSDVSNIGEPYAKDRVLVDAQSGRIAYNYSLIDYSIYREIWDCNSTLYPESLVLEEGGSYPTGIDDVDNTYRYLEDTYDFYYNYHGRLSYDDNDSELVARVRYNEDNAYWTGSYMVLGNGNAIDDIVGHEFTHGVIDSECELVNGAEAGAIAESLCDMWGEWIDQTNSDGNDCSNVKWRIFEDWECWGDPNWGECPNCVVWRRMDDPTACKTQSSYWYGGGFPDLYQPDRYESNDFYRGTGQDLYFCHHNLGVGNKLCYLLTDGDTFNGYTIEGMGIPNTAKLFYECVTNLLTPGSDYRDLGNALIQAAINLEEELSLTEDDIENVIKACMAVEIHDSPIISDSNWPYYGVGDPNYKYVIITSEALAEDANDENPNYSFQALCDSKWDRDISASIITTDWIYANYDPNEYDPNNYDSGDPNSATNRATSIRMFLMDAYANWGTEYCLLGGNEDIVPARKFCACFGSPGADMYYGCLDRDCTFNYDNDSAWGEPNDGAGGGEVDLEAEVCVGRGAVADVDEVLNFVGKTLAYETTDIEDSYLRTVLTAGGALVESETDPGFCKKYSEYVRLGSSTSGYTTVGFENCDSPCFEFNTTTLYDGDYDWTGTWSFNSDGWPSTAGEPNSLLDLMNGDREPGTPHIVYHGDHGNIYYSSKIYTSLDTRNDYGTEFGRDDPSMFGTLEDLDNTNYFFMYDDSCFCGMFASQWPYADERCFAEKVTTMAHGAFAAIMASWGVNDSGSYEKDDGWPTTTVVRSFFDAVLDKNVPELGLAHELSKEAIIDDIDDQAVRLSYYEMTLFGDPELSLRVSWQVKNLTQDRYYHTIQDAIDDANDGDIIEAAPGTYEECIDFDGNSVTVRSVDPNDWGVVAATVIDAGGAATNCVDLDANSVLSGLTIRNTGSSNYGLMSSGTSAEISNCIVEDCGYGIGVSSGSANIHNSIVRDNTYYGVYATSTGTCSTKNCTIYGNGSMGLYATCSIGTTDVINCSVVDNNWTGIYITSYNAATIKNCIVWGHTIELNLYGPTYTVTYCCVEDGYSGNGNISSNPKFIDAVNDDYHLQDDSPCVNSGDPNEAGTDEFDIDGDPRAIGGRIDMGGDERRRVYNVDKDMWYATINGAIDDASNGNEIVLCAGTFYEGSSQSCSVIDFDGKAITLRGEDADDWGVIEDTVFVGMILFDSNEGADSIVSGLTLKWPTGTGCWPYRVKCVDSSPTVRNCIMDGFGSGVYTYGASSSPIVYCCDIRVSGTGILCYAGGTPIIKSNMFLENSTGIQLFPSGNYALIENNTICGCTWGIRKGLGSPEPTITNCILWDNGTNIQTGFSATWCCVEGGWSGEGNIASDPCFVDTNNGDYHLKAGSGCINAGDPNGTYTGETDIDGDSREMGGRVDMGADETLNVYNINKSKWYATIGEAISDANNGDEIVAYPGTYNEMIDLCGIDVTLRSVDPCDWDVVAATIIYGSTDDTIDMDSNSVVTGLTISGTSQARGVWCSGGGGTICNCIIKDRGIAVYGGSLNVQNCEIFGCWAGLTIDQGDCVITNSVIKACLLWGIVCGNSESAATNCTIVDNGDPLMDSKGIWLTSGSLDVTNCIVRGHIGGDIVGNVNARYSCFSEADANDGNTGSEPRFANIYDFLDVTTGSETVTTIKVADASLYSVNDVIEYDNDGVVRTVTAVNTTTDIVTFANDPLASNSENYVLIRNWGIGATDVDEDYTLASDSPCIDAGYPDGDYDEQTDIDGDPRVIGGRVDMGADEVPACYTGPDYDEWKAVGRPDSWCYPRQCHGDADGLEVGDPKAGYYWVTAPDLNILNAGWKQDGSDLGDYDPDNDPNGWIAADFNHAENGTEKGGYYRVQESDLGILVNYWKIDSAAQGDDPNVPADCLD